MKIIQERKSGTIGKEYDQFLYGVLASILEEAASLSKIHVKNIYRKGVSTPMAELIGFTRSDIEVNIMVSGWMTKTNEITILVFIEHGMAGSFDFEISYNVYNTSVSDIAKVVSGRIPS